MLAVPLPRSYLTGCLLPGAAPWIVDSTLTIVCIAVPPFLQTGQVFARGCGLAHWLRLPYRDAAPAAMIGACHHFELASATTIQICRRTTHWFPPPPVRNAARMI